MRMYTVPKKNLLVFREESWVEVKTNIIPHIKGAGLLIKNGMIKIFDVKSAEKIEPKTNLIVNGQIYKRCQLCQHEKRNSIRKELSGSYHCPFEPKVEIKIPRFDIGKVQDRLNDFEKILPIRFYRELFPISAMDSYKMEKVQTAKKEKLKKMEFLPNKDGSTGILSYPMWIFTAPKDYMAKTKFKTEVTVHFAYRNIGNDTIEIDLEQKGVVPKKNHNDVYTIQKQYEKAKRQIHFICNQ